MAAIGGNENKPAVGEGKLFFFCTKPGLPDTLEVKGGGWSQTGVDTQLAGMQNTFDLGPSPEGGDGHLPP